MLFRKSMRFGPLKLNFGKRGFTSWGLKLGPWSWNSRTRSYRVDLPGPFSWTSKGGSSRFARVMLVVFALVVLAAIVAVFIGAKAIGL